MRRLGRGSKLVVASHNKGKVWEINQLIQPFGLDAVSVGDLGLAEPAETETTFRGNALIKAKAAAEGAGLPALADDSGLEIDLLDGAPGVYSADWAGPGRDFGLAMARVNEELGKRGAWKSGSPPRANFISVLCLAWPDGAHEFYVGRVFGHLVWPDRGGNGFGYDPMFVPDGGARTYGEMDPAEKYAGSHRTRAFAKFKSECLGHFGEAAPRPSSDDPGLSALTAAAANISTQSELAAFVANLRADLKKHADHWENATLDEYLKSLSAYLNDATIPDEPKWRTMAKVLLAARGYE